jgi:uncharacterized protein YaiI (UPF0178 family)
MKSKKVIFFVDHEWSMGRVHTDLVKYLYKNDIESNLLSWQRSYTYNEVFELGKVYDLFVSNGAGVHTLTSQYGIPLEQCILMLYHPIDLEHALKFELDLTKLYKITATSSWIISLCKEAGINNVSLTRLGINTNAFKLPISDSLKTIGYAQALYSREATENWRSIDSNQPAGFKRGYLVQEIANELQLPFKSANPDRQTFLSMPGFYNTVDVVICSSQDEGAGGSMIEAAAAGRLCITTDVGGYREFIGPEGADACPVEEKEFKEAVKEKILFYINNPKLYRERCKELQNNALKKYDFSNVILDWITLFN